MTAPVDITNQRFGILTALVHVGSSNGSRLWKCHCECGNETIVSANNLRCGNVHSCGCLSSRAFVDITGQKFNHIRKDKRMSNQERLDKLENLILSAGGTVKVFSLMRFGKGSKELQQIENLLGDALAEVLALKQELGCTSTLSIVEEGQEDVETNG